jgi:hypothetical protein
MAVALDLLHGRLALFCCVAGLAKVLFNWESPTEGTGREQSCPVGMPARRA